LVGSVQITAFGIGGPGQVVFSTPVTIDVEPSAPITTLALNPANVRFSFVGQQLPLSVNGAFGDGTAGPVTQSSSTIYRTSNPSVAVVDNRGVITATGGGSTTVTVSSGGLQAGAAVTVPITVRGDLNGDGKVDQDDVNVIVGALGTPVTKPTDARDLNKDGVINLADAQILVSLCSTTCQLPGGLKDTPVIVWAKPASIAFGSALGSGQLNASASVPGTFVYSPSAGTVLPVGTGQVLSAMFTPSNVAVYNTAPGSTTVDVLPATSSGVKIIVTSVLSRDVSKNIVAQLSLANTGLAGAANVVLTTVKIGTSAGAPLPQTVGAIPADCLAQATVTVPGSAGLSGASSSLTIGGSYTGGTFSVASRITLP
jgi:hypothetical protein